MWSESQAYYTGELHHESTTDSPLRFEEEEEDGRHKEKSIETQGGICSKKHEECLQQVMQKKMIKELEGIQKNSKCFFLRQNSIDNILKEYSKMERDKGLK